MKLKRLLVTLSLAVMMLIGGCATRYDEGASPSVAPSQEQTAEQSATPSFVVPHGDASGGSTDLPERTKLVIGQGLHQYDMQLELDEQGHLLTGRMTVAYNNQTGTALQSIPFQLYANAFAKESTAPFFETEMSQAYPNGFSPGGIDITALRVDGTDAAHTLENDDQTVMQIALPNPLESGSKANIEFEFTVRIPNSLGRFGYGDKGINLCNFYPIACAWDGSKFYTYPYYKAGDPFVSDVSDYKVSLSVPEGMVAAYSGNGKETSTNGITTVQIEAPMVRDFAAVVSRDMAVASKKINGIEVKSYFYKDDSLAGKKALTYGANAIKSFNSLFGAYPYDSFSVVQTDFFIGGMEYPGIVLIDNSLYSVDLSLEYVVVHEAAHQWWYAVVGNDQIMEPWLDEALAEYSTVKYYGETYTEQEEKLMYDTNTGLTAGMLESQYGKDIPGVSTPMSEFDNSGLYSYCIYTNGNIMFHEIEEKIGRDKMISILQTYYQQNSFKRSTKDILVKAFTDAGGQDVAAIFDKWL